MTSPSPQRSPYRPHFKRVESPNVKLQPRDVEILRQVHRHRFLRSTHIASLVGGSEQHVRRRLQLLFHHGYLDRPREQLDYHGEAGKKPYAYALGNKGADLLAGEFDVSRGRVDWTAKNRTVGQIFLEHTLLTAELMVGLEVACRERGSVRLIDADEIVSRSPDHTQRRRNPLAWQAVVQHEGHRLKVGVQPDRVFGLHYLELPEGRNRAYFFLESDRGTMPVERRTLTKTSVHRKLLAYHETWRGNLHTRDFNLKSFRVLTVTSGPERALHIREAAQRVTRGAAPGLFLVTDRATVERENPLTLEWHNTRGERISLLP